MNKRTVLAAILLMTLGAGAGLLWRKLEGARGETAMQAPADPAVATNPEPDPAAVVAPATLPAKTSQMTLKVKGNARPHVPQVLASPTDLHKRAELRKKLMEMNPLLATALELTPEEAEGFFDLLARQQIEVAELIASRPGSIRNGVYSADLLRDIRTLELSGDAELAAMLGSKYPQWLEQQKIEIQRHPVDQLQGMLAGQGIVLGDTEFDPLVAALAEEQKRLGLNVPLASAAQGRDPRRELQEQLQRDAAVDRAMINVASRYLNRQQLEAYEQLLEQRALTAQRLLRTMEHEAGE